MELRKLTNSSINSIADSRKVATEIYEEDWEKPVKSHDEVDCFYSNYV